MRIMYNKFVKRFLDIFLSAIGIIVLALPMLVIALLVKISSPGPAIFKQKRVAIHKTYFNLFKFRTMRTDTPHDMPTHLLTDPQQHITKIGRFLRKTSLDELPQLFNIVSGKMSIVGPRPALWNQYDLIAERDKYGANDIVPGLTGWAQVNGRDELTIEEKAHFDGEYVKNMSVKLDWTCFWMTVSGVLVSKGVIEGGTGVLVKQIDRRHTEINANPAHPASKEPVGK